ncbi:MAG: cyclic nucleotide-binding domain-containing protein [Planctomycetes bacterium]|nr:cyclic nucleotide-binding domain-containing protein [Planctomycetota bacterium]
MNFSIDVSEALRGFTWGFLSAVSLPLGAVIGLWLAPTHRWTSALMAFGGGALLAALTLELVVESEEMGGFWVMGAGFLGGSLLYMALNHVVNGQGGFLRSESTTIVYLTEQKRAQTESMLERLSRVDILRALPPDEVESVLPMARPVEFKAGEVVFEQGAHGDRLYLIDEGQAEVLRARAGGDPERLAVLGSGDTFGEMALLRDEARSATVRATTDLAAWGISREDFQRLVAASPRLGAAVEALLQRRLDAPGGAPTGQGSARAWARAAMAGVSPGDLAPTSEDILHAQKEAGGAPMAIWLGILLDGIPESLVIGASMVGGATVSPALICGVFLANFPEAMSSAVGMRRQGMTWTRVMVMWASLALMTGLGAAAGILGFGSLPASIHALTAAMAAGAMLTMIAETMLPEAVEQGGSAVGLMTVLGFLAAVFTSTLDH